MCSALIARVSPGVKRERERDSVFDADYMSRRDTTVNTEWRSVCVWEGWEGLGGWRGGGCISFSCFKRVRLGACRLLWKW